MSYSPSGPDTATRQVERCPLCGDFFDPVKGHTCGESTAAGVELEAEELQEDNAPPTVMGAKAPAQPVAAARVAAPPMAQPVMQQAAAPQRTVQQQVGPQPSAPQRVQQQAAPQPVVPQPSGAQRVVSSPVAPQPPGPQQLGPRPSGAQRVVPPAATSQPGTGDGSAGLADRYEILQELSRGGMGVVYKARHKVLNNIVAIKVLLKPGNETDQRRFLQEAQLASKVNHPNTVYISDFGVLPDGKSFLVMEYMEGPTLTALLRKQPKKHQLDVIRACRIAAQIAHGMQTVHDKGIVHRDLKPDNIFILDHSNAKDGTQDFVKIVDFGIAKDTAGMTAPGMTPELEAAVAARQNLKLPAINPSRPRGLDDSAPSTPSGPPSIDSSANASSTGGITEVGASVGTPRYMAPEQIDGKNVGPAADQYALGCILYQMISGHAPFSGDTSMALFAAHMVDPPVPLQKRCPQLGIPDSLDAVVLRMLAKKPFERFVSMFEVATALEREIEVLSLKRGDKVVMSSGLAALLGGRKGTHVIIRGRKIPLVAAAAGAVGLLCILALASVLGYRRFLTEPTTLEPGELRALEEEARQVLLEDLRNGTAELRLGAMSGLGQTHDGRFRSALEEKLNDPSPIIQAQAADALGLLGDRKAVPALVEVMKRSESGPVQLATAQALVALGDEQGMHLLETELDNESEQRRVRAASLLCERGQPKALEIINKVIADKRVTEEVAVNLLTCLSHAGDETARQKLRAQLIKAATPENALLAAAKLAQLGQEDGRAYLRERIRKPDPSQLLAARFLAAPDEPQVAGLFRQVLHDRRAALSPRLLAIEGLGLSGQLIDARLLGKQLDSTKEQTARLGAATSIILLARSEPNSLSDDSMRWARSALSDNKWAIREAAAGVIGDSTASDAVPLLAKLLADKVTTVRQSAARALGRRHEDTAAAALREGLRDSEGAVRQECLHSLLRLSKTLDPNAKKKLTDNASAWVKDTIDGGSDAEKALARSLLLRLGDRSQLGQLRDLAASEDAEVRQLVVENLGHEDDVLLSLLKDSNFLVRFGAAQQLAEAGDHRAVPVLKEALERKSPEALLALSLLRKLGEKVELPAGLVNALTSGSLAQRLAAAEIAAKLPAELALLLLRPLAHDADPQVRRLVAAAAALPPGPDGVSAGVPILRLLANDPDPSVRARAGALLIQLLPIAEVEAAAAANSDKGDKAEKKGSGRATDPKVDTPDTTAPPTTETPDAGAAAEAPENPENLGSGTLIVEAEPLVSFEIDHGHWQRAGKQPIKVTAGAHQIFSLSGVQKIELKDKETLNVTIPASQIEKLAQSGLEAAEHKDFRKGQKLLDKVIGLCSHERKHPQPCNDLSIEILYQLGQMNQTQERFSEAMTDYQQVVTLAGSSKVHEERRSAAQKAMNQLLPNLGQVIIPKKVKNRCQEVTLYMLPGTHQIETDSETQTVKVRAQETVRLGSCN